MTNPDLYQAIFKRRSVRKYSLKPLPGDVIADLQHYLGKIKPLDPSILTLFAVVNQNEVSDPFRIKAPHYLCLFSEPQGSYLMNAGFLLQQVDLYLSSRGLGSCWLGLAKPTEAVPTIVTGLHYVIMLAFGEAEGPVHRASTDEFKRKTFSDITDVPYEAPLAAELLEPVRLAPSASNTQPWFFTGKPEELTVWRKPSNLLQAALYTRMNKIDMGIALCHLWLAADHLGKEMYFSFEPTVKRPGLAFMAKATLSG